MDRSFIAFRYERTPRRIRALFASPRVHSWSRTSASSIDPARSLCHTFDDALSLVLAAGDEAHTKTRFFALMVLAAVSAPFASASIAQTAASCDPARLPARVNELLNSKFSGWRPERVADLEGDDRKFWFESHSKECPGIAVGHFESKDALSYAVLLVPASEKVSGYQLIVFSKAPNTETYISRVIERREGKDYFAPVISIVPPGKYTGFDDSKSAVLKLDGINVEWIEKSSFVCYWREGHYLKLWTSD